MVLITILGIIAAVIILGVASLAVLPSIVGALIPTVAAAVAAWFIYRLVRKGCKHWKDWTDK